MRLLLLLLGVGLSFSVFAQCENERYREFQFAEVTTTTGVEYGNNLTYQGAAQALTMDIYQPTGDAQVDRPLVMIAHGGFFVGGSSDGTDVVPMCTDLAKMGYVVASINYRLGWPLASDLSGPMTAAVMRGTQDMKAAIRWFRKNAAENGNTYNIDPNQIYLGGVSAGGYIALHHAYLDQEAEIPSFLNWSDPGISGGIEGESGNAGYSSQVNAIFSVAGAIGDTAWIQADDEPCLLFHGTNDNTVPFGSDMQYAFGVVAVTEVDGSNSINEKMDEIGLEHCFEIYEGQDHVPHVSNIAYYDTTLSIITNFLSHHICDIELDCEYRMLAVNTDELSQPIQRVFPNPAELWITLPDHVSTVTLTSIQGQRTVKRAEGNKLFVGDIARGIYLITWSENGTLHSEKIILN
ncbi:MAG: alpha/beta hydrolase fold domain-containing protein [Flavobacteriales bacterium]